MKVIEIGNCLPNNEPGIIISGDKGELHNLGNLLYHKCYVEPIWALDLHKRLDKMSAIDAFFSALWQLHKNSLTIKEILKVYHEQEEIIKEEYKKSLKVNREPGQPDIDLKLKWNQDEEEAKK